MTKKTIKKIQGGFGCPELLNGKKMYEVKSVLCMLMTTVVMIFTSCADYDNSMSDIEDRIDHIEGTSLTTVDQQVTNINTSITNLEALDEQLQQLIDDLETKAEGIKSQLDDNATADAINKQALEAQIANIQLLITEVQAKDVELDNEIVQLRTYVDNEISATKDWANTTFATLTQYENLQVEIANIKVLLEQHKNDISAAYTKAIKDAISASEESMKTWVNKKLAEGYYDIAAIDAKLTSLETKLTDADTNLKKDIEDQKAALEQAKKDLTAAYSTAITAAINNYNGIITAQIANDIAVAKAVLQSQINTINTEIGTIKKRLDTIEGSISTIGQQITAINTSIEALENADVALQQFIDELETSAESLQSQLDNNTDADAATKLALETQIASLNSLIANLQNKDTELQQKIDALKAYVDNNISTTKDWASATFATLTQHATLNQLLTTLQTQLDNLDNAYATDSELTSAIEACQNTMKTWVNGELQSISTSITALESTVGSLGDTYATDTELDNVKSELQTLINQITENNGTIDDKISSAINSLMNGKIKDLETAIDAIKNRIQSIRYLPEYSDGKIKFSSSNTNAQLTFILSPAEMASTIATAYNNSSQIVSAWISFTTTRSSGNSPVQLTVSGVTGNDSGELTVAIDASSISWNVNATANIFIRIIDDNNNIISELIPVVYE